MEETFFIGEAGKKSGTTVKTIRYYEEIGLIPQALRRGKYRIYNDQIVERIRFIRTSQTLGFSLEEIREILGAYDLGLAPCSEVDNIVNQKLPLIEGKILELQSLHNELSELKDRLPKQGKHQDSKICPIIYGKTSLYKSRKK